MYSLVCAGSPAVLLTQALVGLLGFWFHVQANPVEPGHSLFDRLVNSAPPMAPLLFRNLVGLALSGMWAPSSSGDRFRPVVARSNIRLDTPGRGAIHENLTRLVYRV